MIFPCVDFMDVTMGGVARSQHLPPSQKGLYLIYMDCSCESGECSVSVGKPYFHTCDCVWGVCLVSIFTVH